MVSLSETIHSVWEQREGPVVFTTVDSQGLPNAIYATCVNKYGDNKIVVADNYFNKTRNNILSGSKGSILFITHDGKSYQMKGTIEYHEEGDVYKDMKNWNPNKHPGYAAAVLVINEIYSGAKKLA